MTEFQFAQALIVVLLIALFALMCWFAVLINELIRTVRRAGEAMQSKLSENYEVFQQLVTELQDVRATIAAGNDQRSG
jgi:Tfp pilus assembly protein PilO